MTKLRNIGYLRFGSKIWQDFAVATPSLTPRLSFFPLWMLFAANAGVGGPLLFILGGGSRPLPGGRPACRPSTGRQGFKKYLQVAKHISFFSDKFVYNTSCR